MNVPRTFSCWKSWEVAEAPRSHLPPPQLPITLQSRSSGPKAAGGRMLVADILQTPPRIEADQKRIWEISNERQASLCLHGFWLKKKKKNLPQNMSSCGHLLERRKAGPRGHGLQNGCFHWNQQRKPGALERRLRAGRGNSGMSGPHGTERVK